MSENQNPNGSPPVVSGVASQLRELLRKETEQRKAEQELASLRQEVEQARELSRLAKENPMEAARRLGLVAPSSQQQPQEPDDEARRLVAELRQERENYARMQAEQKRHQLLGELRTAIREDLAASSDKWELLVTLGAEDYVLQALVQAAEQGQQMTVEEAAARVEDALGGQLRKALASETVRAKYSATPEAEKPPEGEASTETPAGQAPSTPAAPPTPTITQNLSTEVPTRIAKDPGRPETTQERIADAAKYIRFTE